jgi:hypothetical protein
MYISVINVFRGFRPQQIVVVEIRLPPPTTQAKSQIVRQTHSRILMIEREIHLTFSITFKILSIILYFSLFNQQRVSYRGVWCVEITNSIPFISVLM